VLADREDHGESLRLQAPRHERQRLPGSSIEPLRIIDQAHQRTRLGQQAQDRKRHQELIRGGAIL
jgi:hypothetical protein